MSKQIRSKKRLVDNPPIISTKHEKICADYIAGMSTIKLGVKYNIRSQSIYVILLRNGIQPRSRHMAAILRNKKK